MDETVRIAVVGLGWVCKNRHIPSLLRTPGVTLVGAVCKSENGAERLAQRYRLPFFARTGSLAEVPWLHEVDAIVIGASPMAHASLALEALTRGKHVLCEKPIAMTVEEGRAMAEAARDNKRTLAVVHNFQFSRALRALEKDLAQGRLGAIRRIAATQLGNPARRLPEWNETLPFGLFYDESPHFFYLLRRLGGALTLKRAHARASLDGKNTPALIHLLYETEKGFPATIDCQFDGALSEWHLRVSGDKATGLLDIFRDIYIRLPNDGRHEAGAILRTSLCAFWQHCAAHVPNGLSFLRGRLDYGNDTVFARFAHAIRMGAEPAEIGARDALDVLEKQHEALKALGRNEVP